MFSLTRPDELSFAAENAVAIPRPANTVAEVFTEARENPIRPALGMQEAWRIQAEHQPPSFVAEAKPGEFFVFQIGVQALEDLGPLGIAFGALTGEAGSIPASSLRCLGLGGTNYDGSFLTKSIRVPAGRLQALWVGVDVPTSAHGDYTGTAQLHLKASNTLPVSIKLTVAGEALTDHGDSVAKNLSRLRWLGPALFGSPLAGRRF